MHCPPGEICFGECHYAEADSAITGLALLAFLGAGRSQADGEHAETVRKGIDFLLSIQKEDGDLRGSSKAVGMYCHAMASLALCEAYALTRDPRLREPVRRGRPFSYAPEPPMESVGATFPATLAAATQASWVGWSWS